MQTKRKKTTFAEKWEKQFEAFKLLYPSHQRVSADELLSCQRYFDDRRMDDKEFSFLIYTLCAWIYSRWTDTKYIPRADKWLLRENWRKIDALPYPGESLSCRNERLHRDRRQANAERLSLNMMTLAEGIVHSKVPWLFEAQLAEYMNANPPFSRMSESDAYKRFFLFMDNVTPYDFLLYQQEGISASPADRALIHHIEEYHLPNGVINVLLSYSLQVKDNTLPSSYILKIAGSLIRKKVKNAFEAIHYLKQYYASHPAQSHKRDDAEDVKMEDLVEEEEPENAAVS